MGTVIVPWKSQLSRTSGNEKGKDCRSPAATSAGVMVPVTVVATMFPRLGTVKSLSLVYFAIPESRGRYDAHASFVRADAARRLSIEAFAFQLVFPARIPACSAVIPPG